MLVDRGTGSVPDEDDDDDVLRRRWALKILSDLDGLLESDGLFESD